MRVRIFFSRADSQASISRRHEIGFPQVPVFSEGLMLEKIIKHCAEVLVQPGAHLAKSYLS